MEEPKSSAKQGVAFLRTCFNAINTLQGLGILSVPYALSLGGWLTLSFLLLIATICCYTGLLLQRCMDANSSVKTYPDIGELAFGRKARIMVATFMYLELYLVSILFLILEGDNLIKLYPNYNGLEFLGLKIGGKPVFVLLAALIVLPTTWLRNLGMLAYVSFAGVLTSVILVGCILWSGTADGVGFHERGRIVNWDGIPTAVSLYVLCYSGHAVFPTIYNSMRNKTQFYQVLIISISLCTLSFGSVAVMGYLMFGERVKSEVTLNLPTKKFSSKIAIYTTIITPLTKYALLITPVATALEDVLQVSKNRLISLLLRTLLVISTTVAALTLPFFGHLTTLTGSFLCTTASLILPCICYLKIYKKSGVVWFEQVIVMVIIVIGVSTATMGTYYSSKQIINNF